VSIAIIINPISGGGRKSEAWTRAELAAKTVERLGETAEVVVTERVGHARLLAQAAVRRGVRLVIAWGGDGTINEVASALAFGEVPLAIVPAGSGNGLATELGIDARPERAIIRAVGATPRRMDVGELGGRLFVNVAGIGLDAHVAAEFNADSNKRRGFVSYLYIGLRTLFTYSPAVYTITADDCHQTVRAVFVVVANSAQFGNGARIAPGARIDDGELDLVIVEERSRLLTCFRAAHLFTGTVARVPGYSIRRARQVTIECADPMAFHVDGEPVAGGAVLTARVHPGALRICV
jgi:YegS/Rv2252/BmrU family lipid kinase